MTDRFQNVQKAVASPGAAATFRRGFADSLPICFGYCAVAFTLAAAALAHGHPVWSPILLSLTQFSGTSQGAIVGKVDFRTAAAASGAVEVAMLCLALNLRYALMAVAVAQKLPPGTGLRGRLVAALGVTDEITAVAVSRPFRISASYVAGLFAGSALGWNVGTLLGTAGTSLLPHRFVAPLGIALYAMFTAIIVPAAKRRRRVLFAAAWAVALNAALRLLPDCARPPSGVLVLVAGVVAAAACAFAFPGEESGNAPEKGEGGTE